MKLRLKKIFLLLSISVVILSGHAQTIPVGTPSVDNYYRRSQLVGEVDSTISFLFHPLFPESLQNLDSAFYKTNSLLENPWISANTELRKDNENIHIQLMPLIWKQQFNSKYPYGWNDGAMIPARGYQTLLSGGLFAKIGFLSIQLMPEYIYAANAEFEAINKRNSIDLPQRFGDGKYSQATWGQSSIRLNFGPASLGLSNENLWWGPGRRNSLLMSNNAPGFKHITLNTTRPISTGIGAFEAQFIGARLESSGIAPYDETYPEQEWRYMSGMNVSYQPKWLPGVYLGFTRVFNAYNDDVVGIAGFVPFLTPFQKKNTNDGDDFPRDQILSFYTKWLFPKAKAELYFEYGQNDNSHDFRDFIGAPDHSRTYLFGFSKLLPLRGRDHEFIEIVAEATQTSQSIDRILRPAGSWYTHSQIKHGYTNKGQIIGAGMDLGANMQSLDVSWVKGMKRIGLSFDRYEHNPHDAPTSVNGHSRRWVDYALAGSGEWSYKNIIAFAKLQGIKSLNYQWKMKDYDVNTYYIPHNDVFNFHGELGFAFIF